jgi:hypothetical protein
MHPLILIQYGHTVAPSPMLSRRRRRRALAAAIRGLLGAPGTQAFADSPQRRVAA